MKKIMVLIVLMLNLNFIYATQETLDSNLTIDEIKTNLFVVTHSYPWASNSVVSIMENGDVLIIDTPYTPKAMELVLLWINKNFGERKIVAINTHFHIDRLGGNEILIKNKIPIYSSELTVKAIKERGIKSIELLKNWISDGKIKQYYNDFEYIFPNKVFNSADGLTLNFKEEKVELKYYGIGHSVDNLIVYLPKKKAIFGGCMIISSESKSAGNTRDGDVNEWKKAVEKIEGKDYDLVIPGHGKEGGTELIKHTIEILEKSK